MKEMKQRTQLFSVLLVACILVACIWVGMSLTAVAQTTDPIQPYLSAPSNVPRMIVYTATEDVADGYIFTTSSFSRYPLYNLIFDNDGELIYYDRTGSAPNDFKVQPTGELSWMEWSAGEYKVMDETYALLGVVRPVDYHRTDNHGLQLTTDGRSLQMIYHDRTMDLTAYGGQPDATVTDCVVQEQDAAGNVTFEWHTLDHIPVTDYYREVTDDRFNPTHCNSLEYDFDGNILISYRNLDEVTKVNITTGEVMWRLGGKGSDFTFINDDGFIRQHDARRLPDGSIALFDNRTGLSPQYSRGVKYQLDLESMTAEKVWEYRHPNDLYTAYIGNMHNLPNGNSLLNWGSSVSTTGVSATEVTPDGEIVFEFGIDIGAPAYRIFRFPWVGRPTEPPVLVSSSFAENVILYMSWNGATEHVAYNIYHSAPGAAEQLVGTAPRTGFETTFQAAVSDTGLHQYRVVAVDQNGAEMLSSISETVLAGTELYPLFLPVLIQN